MQSYRKAAFCAVVATLVVTGCASGPNGNGSSSGNSLTSPGSSTNRLITFSMSIDPNGVIDRTGNGYYFVLFNANGDPIEVTDLDTFTDMVRFDGINFGWYHRVQGVPAPGFFLTFTSNINDNGRVSGDQHSVQFTFNVDDASSPFNQFLVGTHFTTHACTSDTANNAIRGRILDAYGPGPNLDSNTAFTVTADKLLGTLNPVPANFPTDPVGDFITYSDLPPSFPYANFDITSFDVTIQQ